MTRQDRLLKAKIPGPETGIEIRKSICDICTPNAHCGLDVYVKDGIILKVEGTKGFPRSDGKLCTKGACNRQYVYREGRLKSPMRRTGPRGSGQFESISWEEAYREIAQRLLAIREKDGPEAVAWYTGYSKWFRPWLHRMAHSFGSLNYGTESSSCYQATAMAWKTIAGREYFSGLAQAGVYIGWGCNTANSMYLSLQNLRKFKARGGKIIIVDPRSTPTSRSMADIHLQIRPGTDGALALGMAALMIQNGWIDQDFVDKYVHGYEEFRDYALQFTPERTAAITGVPEEQLREAVELYVHNLPAAAYMPSAAVTHHINGFNNMRAIISLQVLTGGIDCQEGALPSFPSYVYADCGFDTMEEEFVYGVKPRDCRPRIGEGRFPVWSALIPEFQAMDLPRQIREGTPYPIKAVMAFGMNARMFPQSARLLETLDSLELLVATDIVETDVCRHADFVLPVCTSLERSELKGYSGGWLTCTAPAIPPLYDSRNDAEILCQLAEALDLDDPILRGGYEHTMRFLISNLPVTLEELRAAPLPLKMPLRPDYKAGTFRSQGFETPTGKLELCSTLIQGLGRPDLDPLPTYRSSFDGAAAEDFPLTLICGARLPHAIHSRLHEVPWVRSLRPEPTADLHPQDAQRRGVAEGDLIQLSTANGTIRVRAHLTHTGLPGDVYLYHGYREANANDLLPADHLDPYSGFPGFRQTRCQIRKADD